MLRSGPLDERLLKRRTLKVPWNKRGSRDYRGNPLGKRSFGEAAEAGTPAACAPQSEIMFTCDARVVVLAAASTAQAADTARLYNVPNVEAASSLPISVAAVSHR